MATRIKVSSSNRLLHPSYRYFFIKSFHLPLFSSFLSRSKTKNSTVPPTPETNLNRLRDTMNELRARYTNDQLKDRSLSTVAIGNFRDCKFYISNNEMRGMAFCLAYKEARQSKNNKELCASVGSMICDVSTGFRSSVEAALTGIGVKPLFVRLPSGAGEVPEMDCPSILAYFGCCILLLFKTTNDDEKNYKTSMSSCLCDMRERAGCDPDADLDIPFDFQRATAIRTMLGACSTLRSHAIQYLIEATQLGDTGIGSVCQYLCIMLSWSGMRHFTLINDLLVKPQSPVLLDPRVSREVDDLNEAYAAITAHPNPQFFMYLAPKLELLKAGPSRFPTLIAVAQELERGNYSSIVANSKEISTAGANVVTVYALVELHRKAMPQN